MGKDKFKKSKSLTNPERRTFLKEVAVLGTAAGIAGTTTANEKTVDKSNKPVSAKPPSHHTAFLETNVPAEYSEAEASRYFVNHPGSDFMVDILKGLDIEYVTSNPGSSFRGLQESIINYGGNKSPEFLTCLHEESAVAMGHGYAKAGGKPLASFCHGTVGLQHAAMAIYNAWCDHAPVIIIAGNHQDATLRKPLVEWTHAVQDAALLVRDFTKWDDNPVSLRHFSESLVRAYKIATTPPMGPVVLIADAHLQEAEIGTQIPPIPSLSRTVPPQGDRGALREAAAMLAAAENPVIVADRMAHSANGMLLLVQLAELIAAPVIDKLGRLNFPSDHFLNHTSSGRQIIGTADVVIGLEVNDFWGSVKGVSDLPHREETSFAGENVKLIEIGVASLSQKSNYQNFQRYLSVDLSIAGDAEASLPVLIEELKRKLTISNKSEIKQRNKKLQSTFKNTQKQARIDAMYGWNASPVSTARLCMEIWDQIKEYDWSLVSPQFFQSRWPHRLWQMNQFHQYLGASGGYGIGYGAPAAVGAALANRDKGRLTVNIQADGDMLYAPGVFWTAAHHKIPLLSVMHNNRAYHQETMHLQRMANRRQRGNDYSAKVGNTFEDPLINFAEMAKSLGVWSAGPINDPRDLASALKKAIDVVQQGEPALVDVICQPR